MLKINSKILLLLLIFIFSSCSSIPSLIEEPDPNIIIGKEENYQNLLQYETQLNSYVMYLIQFLVKTKKQVQDKEYPKFTFFDATKLKNNANIDEVKYNISLYKEYIKTTKPIAISVYEKYSRHHKLKRIK